MGRAPPDPFLPQVAAWFRSAMGAPTRAQALGWPVIARGESTLLLAPTGSGKTLAAFLVAIDRLLREPRNDARRCTRVLYVSPLKALAADIERNLRAPIAGICEHGSRAGIPLRVPTVDVRTGDTTPKDRARLRRAPPDILITTPESLYLLLTSRARETLTSIDTLIVDEIHTLVPTKRGAHLAVSLERLEALRHPDAPPLQRIGLSATQRPLDEAARLLGGLRGAAPRPVTIVDAGARKDLDLVVEQADLDARTPADGAKGTSPTTWPVESSRVLELVRAHRSTLVFVNSRRLAERLAAALNEAAGEEVALAHHGSLARERRAAIEDQLKRGRLRALVATSSLELGIDMGALDLVVQIEAPPSVASGLQRIGRACHGVGGVPRGVILSKHRQDLIACAAVASSMRAGEVEETRYPRNPLDVLSQQIVAIVSMESLHVDGLFDLVRQAAPFAELPRGAFDDVLDMLSGRYPSDDFAALRPRVTWDRIGGLVEGRAGSHRLAVTNGGTIPDRGLYGVFTAASDAGPGKRVGELDEEMVFEMREGEVFLLGASSWRAEKITFDRVVASPAAGQPGKLPFWHGERPGRTRPLGLRIGQLVRGAAKGRVGPAELRVRHALTKGAAASAARYVAEQVDATGEVPSDRAVVVERFVDEVGDWRVVVMSPLGKRVIAPWATAVVAVLRATYVDVDLHYTDDGMAFRIPACEAPPATELFFPPAEEVEALVRRALHGTALFASRFRECAARALLLPRRDPRRRTPLWSQRKRAADLLAVAARYPTFPVVLETYRECLRDAFDLPGLVELLEDVAARRVRVTTVDTRAPSPFAASVLFGFVASFIYEADAPLAERRAQALTIDVDRLRQLLGDQELRGLLDPDAIRDCERRLQGITRPASNADAVHDLLLAVGDLSIDELRARCEPQTSANEWVYRLVQARRVVPVVVAGDPRIVAVEDAARLRGALGVVLPAGLPESLLRSAGDPMADLVARYARTHGPFAVKDVADRFGVEELAIEGHVARLVRERRLVEGSFLQRGAGRELCHRDVLESIRRKSLANIRHAIEPVDTRVLARFLPDWQGIPGARRGRGALLAVVAELEGCPLAASALETEILPARLEGYRPADLDSLCASGQVVWGGIERIGSHDGRIALYLAEHEPLLVHQGQVAPGPVAAAVRALLERRGAVFFAEIARQIGGFPGEVLEALWQLVWSGEATNDTLEPLRRRTRPSPREHQRRHPRDPRPPVAGPPGSEGRWSLRASRWPPAPSETDRRAAWARTLLERYGILTREAAHAEKLPGGFAAVYEVLKALEDQGRVKRGYFVEGRGGAQFALPGAEDRLRAMRVGNAASVPIVLSATDPANVWGALLDWPPADGGRPARSAGALVVIRDGDLLGWLGRGDHPLLTFLPRDEPARREAASALIGALAHWVTTEGRPGLIISTVDGEPATESALVPLFAEAGFVPTQRGLLRRRPRAPARQRIEDLAAPSEA